MSDITSLIGSTKILVSNEDARTFREIAQASNLSEVYLFSILMRVILLEDIDFFIRSLSIKFRTQPMSKMQLVQLSILYSLLSEFSIAIGGFD